MPEQSVAEKPVDPVAPQPPVATQPSKPSAARRIGQVIVNYVWFTAALFLAAGRLDWTRGWISVALCVVSFTAMGMIIQRYNPELMAERARWRRKDAKPFDKIFMAVYLPLTLLQPVVAGLDAVRFRWSSIPFAFVYAGAVLFAASVVLLTWAMAVNPHAESSVRIQSDRGHQVVTSGPYRFVRHPMYVGIIVMSLANPLIWGSVWALVMSGVMILLFIWRTAQEDQTLRRELPGYEDFAAHTPYRLVPGVW